MTSWEKLLWLQANAHEVDVRINDHRGGYETVAFALEHGDRGLFDANEADVQAECIRRNELVIVQVYPHTPIGFYRVGHYNLGAAIDAAYELSKKSLEAAAARVASKGAAT